MISEIKVKNRKLELPVFFPDATRGVIRTLDSKDLELIGIPGIVVNTYHLMTNPGGSVLAKGGGLKNFMSWKGTILSDSGGFQLLSLIYENKSFGHINSNGVSFKKDSKVIKFTPEKSIEMQFKIDSDIMICLDDCAPNDTSRTILEASVEHTIEWAKRCKKEYKKQLKIRNIDEKDRPLLFGVIQGGNDPKLRELCAKELIKIGFDGYGFGGWPLDETNKKMNYEILKVTADLMPDNLPKYGLGIGNPKAIIECVKLGYNIFDCVLPTRDARHKRLYTFTNDLTPENFWNHPQPFHYLYIAEPIFRRDKLPIEKDCQCHTCQNFSRSYIHHLFNLEDPAAYRLATIHNLYFYQKLLTLIKTYGKR